MCYGCMAIFTTTLATILTKVQLEMGALITD